MDDNSISAFRTRRTQGQQRLMATDHLGIKRFLSLDSAAYRDESESGGLPAQTKELLGLSASAVLRCDDCITYHVEQAVQAGVPKEHIVETLHIAMIVGGSIVIPHARRALLVLDQLLEESASSA